MTNATAKAIGSELKAMLEAKRELGQATAFLTTSEAVEECGLAISSETLLAYPEWVCPRVEKNPSATRSPLLWDPRDIAALPFVLRQWKRAQKQGSEEDFRRRRSALIEDRDRAAIERIWGAR